ncbi:MAG: LysM peptidoglycan-binding domain-containing protein [Alphaproteobacteria bacterium]|nr:LysM peptidoglycan-binding domain-containing protein [Alphaproteobacteria bacterium]
MTANNKQNTSNTKRSTDDLIDNAISKQNDWLENRRAYTRSFLKKFNAFTEEKQQAKNTKKDDEKSKVLKNYWFPILCALIVVFIAIWVAFIRINHTPKFVLVPEVPVQVTKPRNEIKVPEFDIVRIEKDGGIVIAGRWLANNTISVMVNGRIIATQETNPYGEFVYAPQHKWNAGNYTIVLVGGEPEVKSSEKVFVYISENGPENSVSLLMTKDGSTLLQMPTVLNDNDLTVSKIDYLSSGRIVVTGDGMPRLRVSLSLNDEYIGFARVSDHKHFGLGADVGELKTGQEYSLTIRMHDGDGRTVSSVTQKFTMPEMTGDDDTYYTVRRGDCLWIIARNFMRRGILFSIIADRNNIKNPNLIYPNQLLQVPIDAK